MNETRKKIPIPVTVALITLIGVIGTCVTNIIINNSNKEIPKLDVSQTNDKASETKKDTTLKQSPAQVEQNNENGANQNGFININKTGK